ncbi:unnamed protein product [Phytophthora fragariaefolia]|uniref:Unnamed protein product n=1 Tax=Phytophthora fragariaefolia TaxID=1490495 RepID=A0A9W6X5N8_9STRA|nr:unnamed protein product [Phytophthora fragariaefolia]
MGKSSENTDTAPFDNPRSHEHKPRIAGPPGMTMETQMILRAAPDALGGAGPAEHDADAPSLSETEEKPPAPASKKHSGDPEATKGTSASKKHANDMSEEKKTPATEKPTTGANSGPITRLPCLPSIMSPCVCVCALSMGKTTVPPFNRLHLIVLS